MGRLLRTRPGRRPPRDPAADFHAFHYIRHTLRRLEHLASLGLDLRDKTVLETGAGIGDHTTFFVDRGCRVLATDAREENVERLGRVFKDEPRVWARVLDLDGEAGKGAGLKSVAPPLSASPSAWPPDSPDRGFEIVYCYGLLYHLARPEEAIAYMAERCAGVMLLETSVAFGEEEALNPVEEDARWFSQSATGRGCRPTRPWVHARLSRHFAHVYMPVTQPNHPEFPLDWTGAPTAGPGSANPAAHVRAVFVASRREIENPLLVKGIPMRQVRH